MESELDKPKILAAALCFIGILVFGGLLSYVLLSPLGFEQRAQGFIIAEVEEVLGQRTPMPTSPWVQDVTKAIPEELATRQLEPLAALSDFIVAVVSAMCRLDCADRARLEAALDEIYESSLADMKIGVDKLRAMVEGRYHSALAELRRDVVIFLTSNFVVLMLALLLALLRTGAADHVLPLAMILTISTALGSYWYVFGQNWILTIIYADYFGWSYLACLGVLFLLLVDIGLNRARVTSEVLNTIADLIGFDYSWSPC